VHAHTLWRELRARPHARHRGQRCLCATTTGCFMLAHFVAFCNQYPPGVVRPPRLVLPWSHRRAWPCLQQGLPRMGRIRACQSGVHWHVARVASGTWCPAVCRGWPFPSVHGPHDHASAPRHQPHTLGMTPLYLRETPPCTYGRHPLYLWETKYDLTPYFYKDCRLLTFKKISRRPHTPRVCEA
jgi:hypothetical protein